MTKLILISFLIISICCSTNKVCRNPEGKEVDWYSIFLMPISSSKDNKIHYGYFDPTLAKLKFYEYSENNFPPNQITRYATGGGSDFNYFFWNDDRTLKDGESDPAYSSKAHAKGSLVYDAHYGSFLLHSLPRFPTRNKNNNILTEIPSNAGSYGQTFLCITIDKVNAEQIARLLNCINVSVNKSVNKDRVNSNPNIWAYALINNKSGGDCNIKYTYKIRSKGGQIFTFYGKSNKNIVIPYDTTLREAYKDDIYVRTWSRPALSPSVYGTYNVINVLDVKFGDFGFHINKEHSKWAITKNKNIVCFSDLNHTKSQNDRGGHTVCFQNAKLHNIMKASIINSEEN